MPNNYNNGLDKNDANYSALTPVSFLRRSATVFASKPAVIDDDMTLTYTAMYERCRRMAAALEAAGVRGGDTVSILCHNSHELLECHYAVPMAGAVLNALNTRLDAATLRFILDHAETRVLIYDTGFESLIRETLTGLTKPPWLVAVERAEGASDGLADRSYEDMIAGGRADYPWCKLEDEWDAISLNYTSGTTGNPKGVVYHHRGAYLAAMSNAMAFNMNPETVFLWTLPMFHCNGWCYTWAVTAVGGTHVCLRKVDTESIQERIERYRVSHICGAPIVLNMLLNDLDKKGKTLEAPVQFALGGAAPPSTVIGKAQKIGFVITHLYGLTESYGPATLCVWQDEWASLPPDGLAQKMARQGVANLAIDEVCVRRLEDGTEVPADGATLGEIFMKGNIIMKGYLKNEKTTRQAFQDGWFHTGDLAVVHPDGYIEIKDRSKDIIISGGENISSLEIEEVLYRHPMVIEAAVVAWPDETWGEVPCAFIDVREEGRHVTAQEIIEFCKANLASFKAPKKIVIGELPKTATGKIRKNVLREKLAE